MKRRHETKLKSEGKNEIKSKGEKRKGIKIRGREDMREEKKEGKERTKSAKVW